jgi:hypothetical protein
MGLLSGAACTPSLSRAAPPQPACSQRKLCRWVAVWLTRTENTVSGFWINSQSGDGSVPKQDYLGKKGTEARATRVPRAG